MNPITQTPMILKRYGNTLQSVEVDFDARAMNEIGFRRDRQFSIPVDEFESGYERVDQAELTGRAEGAVQDEAEQAALDQLLAALREFEAGSVEGDLVVVESQQGVDYPKTREERSARVDGGKNLFRFLWSIDPPLKVGRYRPTD